MPGKKTIIATTAGVAAATGLAVAAKKRKDAGRKTAEPDATVYHVKPDGEEWVVEAEGAARASSRHPNKKSAVEEGRSLAGKKTPSRLVIHRADGTVQRQHAYGLDD